MQSVRPAPAAQASYDVPQAATGDTGAQAGAVTGAVQKAAAPVIGAVAHAAPALQRAQDTLPEAAGRVVRSLGPGGGVVSRVVEVTTTVQHAVPPAGAPGAAPDPEHRTPAAPAPRRRPRRAPPPPPPRRRTCCGPHFRSGVAAARGLCGRACGAMRLSPLDSVLAVPARRSRRAR